MDDDATRWNERYRDATSSQASPPDVLVAHPDVIERLPDPGRAVDIACGAGAQSLWLASLGHRVTALDVSPVAIDLTRASAQRAGVDGSIDARVVDLDAGLPTELTDLDVIVCQRFRHPDLYPEIVQRLRRGGVAIVTVLSEVGLSTPAGPFHAPAGDLRDAFTRDDTDVLVDVEADGQASIVLRRR
ncbi:MAG: methyltransferase domain-containing protein [Ilumatobacteraceae bacterium]